jgi:hypothetical protein
MQNPRAVSTLGVSAMIGASVLGDGSASSDAVIPPA